MHRGQTGLLVVLGRLMREQRRDMTVGAHAQQHGAEGVRKLPLQAGTDRLDRHFRCGGGVFQRHQLPMCGAAIRLRQAAPEQALVALRIGVINPAFVGRHQPDRVRPGGALRQRLIQLAIQRGRGGAAGQREAGASVRRRAVDHG